MKFCLPDIGEGVTEAEIIRWLVKEGEKIEENQPVLEVQTDKAVVELPAPAGGKIMRLKWTEGQVVPVGEVLYELEEDETVARPVAPQKKKKKEFWQPPPRGVWPGNTEWISMKSRERGNMGGSPKKMSSAM